MIKFNLYSEKWTRWIVLLFRLIVGLVFIVSGFVKAIDPWGVLYKFQDYVNALGCDWLSPFLLFGSFALSVVEFVVGVCLIIGAYRRVAVWLAFLMMFVMTPLTAWLAFTGAVQDCGCFGEAFVLSNGVTLAKNIVLLLFTWYLLKYNVRVHNIYSPSIQWIVTLITVVYVGAVACYGYFYQPMLDFRPYKVGTKLNAVHANDDEFIFEYEKDGVVKQFTIDDVPIDDSTWHFVARREVVKHQQNTDSLRVEVLNVFDGERDITDEVFSTGKDKLIFVFSDLENIDIAYTYLINILDDYARKLGVEVIGLSDANMDDVVEWNDMSMATYPMLTSTDTQLKMLVRGNPAVVYVSDGVVKWKRVLQSINAGRVEKAITQGNDFMWIVDDYDAKQRLNMISLAYVASMILILVLNRSYRVYKFGEKLIEKRRLTAKKVKKEVKNEVK